MRATGAACGLTLLVLAGCGAYGQGGHQPSGPWSLGGEVVDSDRVQSHAGAEHCNWQNVHFLVVSEPLGKAVGRAGRERTYVRDPKGVLSSAPYLRRGYDGSADLPADAVDTGLRNDGVALWHSPSVGDKHVFVVGEKGKVEAWPLATTSVACV